MLTLTWLGMWALAAVAFALGWLFRGLIALDDVRALDAADPADLGGARTRGRSGGALLIVLLACAAPAAADEPRTWTIWRVDYIEKLEPKDHSITPLSTTALEPGLTRLECEIIRQGTVADYRLDSYKTPIPDGASVMDAPNKRHRVTRFVCSREKPRVP
jgi:hypothetical protein